MTESVRSRAVLSGVPKIHFYEGGPRCPEDVCLPSVMRVLMEYLGEERFGCKKCGLNHANCQVTCSYAFFMGVSGAGSYLSWKKGWDDNAALFYMSDDPEAPERNCFKAAGYAFEWVEKKESADNESIFRQRVIESIDRGMPVISYGIIGPPEPGFITGYDEGGNVIIGWNFFQGDPNFGAGLTFEPDGMYRKGDWVKDAFCLLIVGERQEKPSMKESYKSALEWALRVARVPMVRPEADAPEWYRERANGLAAYDAWADHLLCDEEFPADNVDVLRQHYQTHDMMVGMLAEWRWYGSVFLVQAADPDYLHHDMVADLLHAGGCYATEHALMWNVWDLAGGAGNPEGYKKLADPDVRRKIAAILREAKEEDRQAAEHIERALSLFK